MNPERDGLAIEGRAVKLFLVGTLNCSPIEGSGVSSVLLTLAGAYLSSSWTFNDRLPDAWYEKLKPEDFFASGFDELEDGSCVGSSSFVTIVTLATSNSLELPESCVGGRILKRGQAPLSTFVVLLVFILVNFAFFLLKSSSSSSLSSFTVSPRIKADTMSGGSIDK